MNVANDLQRTVFLGVSSVGNEGLSLFCRRECLVLRDIVFFRLEDEDIISAELSHNSEFAWGECIRNFGTSVALCALVFVS